MGKRTEHSRMTYNNMAAGYDKPRLRAKQNGQWDAPKAPGITDEQIQAVAELLRDYPTAYSNFEAMAPSARKTYTRA